MGDELHRQRMHPDAHELIYGADAEWLEAFHVGMHAESFDLPVHGFEHASDPYSPRPICPTCPTCGTQLIGGLCPNLNRAPT